MEADKIGRVIFSFLLILPLLFSCNPDHDKIRVIFDTDANNELDDQHALAYLLFNGNIFEVAGITVNTTFGGGNIDSQYKEAERIVQLCGLQGKIPIFKGADESFDSIKMKVSEPDFDGADAVNFIIDQAHRITKDKLVVIAVGKMSNLALALKKDPSISSKIRLVWLGSNYPEWGEYNLVNDTSAVNFVLESDMDFELVTVRSGRYTGTAAVTVTIDDIREKMPQKGPLADKPVPGRDGLYYSNFGDYSVSLFQNIGTYGPGLSRSLYDVAAVAIVKNPAFASSFEIPAPLIRDSKWRERPDNNRKIRIWEHFDKSAIISDFYRSMDHYVLAGDE